MKKHEVLEASALAGAIGGAAAGAIGGPPGAVVGGALGTAAGLMAGAVLERENNAAFLHDRQLDEPTETTASAASLLRAEHARLEVIYDRLLEAYRAGDWNDVRAEWEIFEPSLRAHIALEESHVFPEFRLVDPEEADNLMLEHRALCERLDVLGVNVELRAVTAFDAEELVQQLRAHRAREERLLYPWIDATYTHPIARR